VKDINKKNKMKKLLLAFSLVLTMGACQKNQKLQNQQTVSVSNSSLRENSENPYSTDVPILNDGRFVFRDEEHFEVFLISLNDANYSEFEDDFNFISYKKIVQSNMTETQIAETMDLPISSDRLGTILNKFGIVQIGKWIIKINGENAMYYALDEQHTNEIDGLILPEPNSIHVLPFSCEENFFDLMDSDNGTANKCSEKCRSTKKSKDNEDNGCNLDGKNYHYKFELHVDEYGIWTELREKFKYLKNGSFCDTHFDFYYKYNYTKRCKGGNSVIKYYSLNAMPGQPQWLVGGYTQQSNKTIVHYKGTRCLSDYYLESHVIYNQMCDYVNGVANSYHLTQQLAIAP
jgi:hypothetical protein